MTNRTRNSFGVSLTFFSEMFPVNVVVVAALTPRQSQRCKQAQAAEVAAVERTTFEHANPA